ncbi:MAG: hypothetical protein GY842_11960 [bacterium]|nr:hypothetical protein [bacterium]
MFSALIVSGLATSMSFGNGLATEPRTDTSSIGFDVESVAAPDITSTIQQLVDEQVNDALNEVFSVAPASTCNPACDWCWCGTSYEDSCPIEWFYDDQCDCGCQFCDAWCECGIQDCIGGPIGACCGPNQQTPVCFDWDEAECWVMSGAYMGDATTCAGVDCTTRCAAKCVRCWVGTTGENNCDPARNGDGVCDCGCQFDDAIDCADAALESSLPACDDSLWRLSNNFIRLTFASAISDPGGAIQIRTLDSGGTYGATDYSSNFTFTVVDDGFGAMRVLEIRENGSSLLPNTTWIGVYADSGAWSGVESFSVHYMVQVGDVSNDGNVTFSADAGTIYAHVGETGAPDDTRWDVNGDHNITFSADAGAVYGTVGATPVAKPLGHVCP